MYTPAFSKGMGDRRKAPDFEIEDASGALGVDSVLANVQKAMKSSSATLGRREVCWEPCLLEVFGVAWHQERVAHPFWSLETEGSRLESLLKELLAN